MNRVLFICLCAFPTVWPSVALDAGEPILADLVADFGSPWIPIVAFAGAHAAAIDAPEKASIDAVEAGMKPDGSVACDDILRSIIDRHDHNSPLAIRFPAGEYLFNRPVFVDRSRISLIGAGSKHTTFRFTQPLSKLLRTEHTQTNAPFGWRGGLIWIEANPAYTRIPTTAYSISGTAAAGSGRLTIAPASAAAFRRELASSGSGKCHMRLAGNRAWIHEMFGSSSAAQAVDWPSWELIRPPPENVVMYERCLDVESIDDDGTVLLRTPLPVRIDPSWRPVIGFRSGDSHDITLSGLSISFPYTPAGAHLEEPGWNGIFVRVAHEVILDDLVFENADNGIILERTSHATLRNIVCSGTRGMHHAISLRNQSHDNLIDGFRLDAPVAHGISKQDLSSGNVVTRGTMNHGTLDNHRGMPFDNVRTEITLRPDGTGGGAQGPLLGRRIVNWNITIESRLSATASAKDIARQRRREAALTGSQWYVSGALIGIQGAPPQPESLPWQLPPGDKGTLVAAWGVRPEPRNLYDAQRAWWATASGAWRASR